MASPGTAVRKKNLRSMTLDDLRVASTAIEGLCLRGKASALAPTYPSLFFFSFLTETESH